MAYIINPSDMFVLDLDGTLVDTDYANFMSYKVALRDKLRISLSLLIESI